MIELIVRVLFTSLDFFLQKRAHSEAQKKDYIAFLEIMQRLGIASVEKRLKAVGQIERIKEKWGQEKDDV